MHSFGFFFRSFFFSSKSFVYVLHFASLFSFSIDSLDLTCSAEHYFVFVRVSSSHLFIFCNQFLCLNTTCFKQNYTLRSSCIGIYLNDWLTFVVHCLMFVDGLFLFEAVRHVFNSINNLFPCLSFIETRSLSLMFVFHICWRLKFEKQKKSFRNIFQSFLLILIFVLNLLLTSFPWKVEVSVNFELFFEFSSRSCQLWWIEKIALHIKV